MKNKSTFLKNLWHSLMKVNNSHTERDIFWKDKECPISRFARENHEYILLYSIFLYRSFITLHIKRRSKLIFQVKDDHISKFLPSIYQYRIHLIVSKN